MIVEGLRGPGGQAVATILSPVPNLAQPDLDRDHIAEGYADKILAGLEELMPGLRRHVVTKRWLAPMGSECDLIESEQAVTIV